MHKICEKCGVSESSKALHKHHVVGRLGQNKDNPENLITLCVDCHWMWHNYRDRYFEDWMYHYMKTKYGNLFPIFVNGHPYMTKWIARIENEMDLYVCPFTSYDASLSSNGVGIRMNVNES